MDRTKEDIRILNALPFEGITAALLARQLNAGVPWWMFWRRWTRHRLYKRLLKMHDRGLVEWQISRMPKRGRLWSKTQEGLCAVVLADVRARMREPQRVREEY